MALPVLLKVSSSTCLLGYSRRLRLARKTIQTDLIITVQCIRLFSLSWLNLFLLVEMKGKVQLTSVQVPTKKRHWFSKKFLLKLAAIWLLITSALQFQFNFLGLTEKSLMTLSILLMIIRAWDCHRSFKLKLGTRVLFLLLYSFWNASVFDI